MICQDGCCSSSRAGMIPVLPNYSRLIIPESCRDIHPLSTIHNKRGQTLFPPATTSGDGLQITAKTLCCKSIQHKIQAYMLFSTVLIYRWSDMFCICITLCWINHVWVWVWVWVWVRHKSNYIPNLYYLFSNLGLSEIGLRSFLYLLEIQLEDQLLLSSSLLGRNFHHLSRFAVPLIPCKKSTEKEMLWKFTLLSCEMNWAMWCLNNIYSENSLLSNVNIYWIEESFPSWMMLQFCLCQPQLVPSCLIPNSHPQTAVGQEPEPGGIYESPSILNMTTTAENYNIQLI